MGCGQKCLKYLMFGFNFLFFLCGAVLLGLGIWIVVDGASFMDIVAENAIIYNAVYIIIAVGAGLLVISFLGCCGAIQESKCLLGTFFAIVLIIFILEIVGAVLAFVYYPEAEQALSGSIADYNGTSDGAIALTKAWDTVQAVFQCCGYNDSTDWVANPGSIFPTTGDNELVPDSCCTRDILSLSGTINDRAACVSLRDEFYTEGCESKYQNYFWVIGGVGIGILVIEILAMVFSCCLYCAIGKDNYE